MRVISKLESFKSPRRVTSAHLTFILVHYRGIRTLKGIEIVTKMPPKQPKRKIESIDLTGSDEDNAFSPVKTKTPRTSNHALPTPAPSSAPRSSQPTPSRSEWRRPDANESLTRRAPSSTSRTLARTPSLSQPSPSHSSQHHRYGYVGGDETTHTEAEREAWLLPTSSQAHSDETDIYETIASTQNVAVGSEDFVKYSEIPTKIVGVRYYKGFATFGEHVEILREPGNPYDSNAVRVDNMVGEQIGHIPKTMAKKIAPYLDNGLLAIEAVIAGSIGQFDCPIILNAFGPPLSSPASDRIREKMKADRLPLQHINQLEREEKKRLTEERKNAANAAKRAPVDGQPQWMGSQVVGDGSQADPTMDDILSTTEHFDPRNVGKAAEQFGNTEDILAAMPMAEQPPQISTQMLPYQLQALKWLLNMENPKLPAVGSKDFVQLWRRHEKVPNAFTNIATSFSVKDREPVLASGGILADDMGLGKTLELISLIVSDAGTKQAAGTSASTLIIAPVSVMSNWSDQIARHVRKDSALSVYVYHGAGRKSMKAAELAKHDVVITTYGTLGTDYLPKKGAKAAPIPRSTGLYSVKWRRVILDEGHIIRNPQSKGAAAANAVMARSRWVLTGTPIVNTLKDLYSLIRFIGVTGGLEKLDVFNSVLVRPLKAGDPSATALLQAIMSSLCLRRKKEMKFIDLKLPKLEEYISRIDFSIKEKEIYDAFHKQAKGTLETFRNAQGSKATDAYNHLLEILLRMRQTCNHWQLCGERATKLMETLQNQKTVDLNPENTKALQDMLQLSVESQDDCPICLEPLHSPVITHCAHAFGRECISRVIETQKKCPMCRAELPDESILVEPANEYGDEVKDEIDINETSTKLEALINILKASKSSGNKTVIFSQWTRFLDVVETRLVKEGFKFCRIDGTMSATSRDESLHALERDPSCTVMLASLGVCAVGLNLVAANQVIMCDTWWAPAIEDQASKYLYARRAIPSLTSAVDRVHRLGQKKETKVFRLVMDNSIEERTLDIQTEKRKLMMAAFQEKSSKRGAGKNARLGDITKLLS